MTKKNSNGNWTLILVGLGVTVVGSILLTSLMKKEKAIVNPNFNLIQFEIFHFTTDEMCEPIDTYYAGLNMQTNLSGPFNVSVRLIDVATNQVIFEEPNSFVMTKDQLESGEVIMDITEAIELGIIDLNKEIKAELYLDALFEELLISKKFQGTLDMGKHPLCFD